MTLSTMLVLRACSVDVWKRQAAPLLVFTSCLMCLSKQAAPVLLQYYVRREGLSTWVAAVKEREPLHSAERESGMLPGEALEF